MLSLHPFAVAAALATNAHLAPPPAEPPAADGVTRAAMLNLGTPPNAADGDSASGGAIGPVIRADDLRAALPALEAAGVEVLVLRFSAGVMITDNGDCRPGSAAETKELVELIIGELNPRLRTVAWVSSALDTAAVAAWACEDLGFEPGGVLGAAVLEAAPMQAAEGPQLESWLRLGERASKASGRDAAIMRSMQSPTPLSVTRRPEGTVQWSNDAAGAEVINEPERVLTLNWQQAQRLGISSGTAATRDDLARPLGLTGAAWVAEDAAAEFDRVQRGRAAAGD